MTDFNDLLITLQSNMSPALTAALADSLNVSPESVHRLGVGYYPKEQCWVFPERDGNGNVIGLLRRYFDGKKFTWEGSKRGLSYESMGFRQKDADIPVNRPRFIRVSEAGVECPICGKPDWCLVSDEDTEDPAVVVCPRTPIGAVREIEGAGFLHIRHAQPDYRGNPISVLPISDKPVVVTEGASDCLAAMSMGYVAVGRPSAENTPKGLCNLIQGRSVILMGDRDSVGQRGLESTFQTLKPVVKSITKVLPPEGFKDLRAWHPTVEEFAAHVAKAGDTTDDGSVLPDASPYTLAKSWIQQTQLHNGVLLLRRVHGDFHRWGTNSYRKVEQTELRQEWYNFFADKQVRIKGQDGGIKIIVTIPNKKLMDDLNDATAAHCYVRVEADTHEPFLIKTGTSMDLTRAVVFQNGILYIADGRMSPLSPEVFLTSTLPYDYHPGCVCPKWLWFVGDIFNGDQECIALLQEWFGYNLIASNHMQAMMFFFGVPGSGKSTTAAVLRALLGQARCCGASTDNFKAMFGKESLLNKYTAIMSESRDTNKSDIDKLLQTWKCITGGDVVNVARKYKGAVDTRLFCRLTYVANDAIPFDDPAQAMAGRTNLLYFPNNYRKKNPDRMLEYSLIAEIPGIALWAIDGLKRLLTNDKFTTPKVSEEHLAGLAELTNPIGVMLADCCTIHVGTEFMEHCTPCADLYDLWKAWCDDTRTRTSLSSIGFGMKLAHMERPIVRRQIMEAGKRMYVYQGLKINPEAYHLYLKR